MAGTVCVLRQRRLAELFFYLIYKVDSKIGVEMRLIVVEGNTWTMCEFHESTYNGF